jgi:hypothetical protein
MAIKLQESGEVIISAKAGHDRPFTMRWISSQTKDWVIANVKISDTGVYRGGEKCAQITITFDVAILEQLEITS